MQLLQFHDIESRAALTSANRHQYIDNDSVQCNDDAESFSLLQVSAIFSIRHTYYIACLRDSAM